MPDTFASVVPENLNQQSGDLNLIMSAVKGIQS